MRLLLTATQLIGLPVVTRRGGEDVAEVRDVIYSPDAGRLLGLTLNRRGFLSGRHPAVLPAESIHAIGRDAAMIADVASLTARADASDDLADPPVERDVIGDDVLTERGVKLGVVRDLVLLVGRQGEDGSRIGAVVGYQIDRVERGRGFIPLPAQVSISGTALVVPDITEEFVREDLAALGPAVDSFRSRLGLT